MATAQNTSSPLTDLMGNLTTLGGPLTTQVLPGVGKAAQQDLPERLTHMGAQVLIALGLLLLGWAVGRWAMELTYKGLIRARIREAPATFVASAVRFILLCVFVFMAIVELGGSTQAFLALGGTLIVALGLGLKDTLTNVAAGIMILVNQMFQVGDYIGITVYQGTVKRINLFQTEINTRENLRMYIPNKLLWDNALTNFSHNRVRLVEMTVVMPRKYSFKDCMASIKAAVVGEQRILSEPAPLIGVDSFSETVVSYFIRAWVRTPDYLGVRYGLLERVSDEAQARGIDMPPVPMTIEKKPARKGRKKA